MITGRTWFQIAPTIRYEFAYDGGGVGKGGAGTLFANGKNVATGRIERTQCCAFSADEGADVGADAGLLGERPEAHSLLRGRTFARTLH